VAAGMDKAGSAFVLEKADKAEWQDQKTESGDQAWQ
jgi:hypothetical protein